MTTTTIVSREELAKHVERDDMWVAIKGKVYDMSKFINRHPGGHVIAYYKGQDASDAFHAFHPTDEKMRDKLEKMMRPLCVGELEKGQTLTEREKKSKALMEDFRELEQQLEAEGMFKSNKTFFALWFVQVVLFELAGLWVMMQSGWVESSWLPWLIGSLCLATAQIQAGWLQHDLGHLSVFRSSWWNQATHYIVIGVIKGASSFWWKIRHNLHHAKTNVVHRDPDTHNFPLFLFSDQGKKEGLAGNYIAFQKLYWWFLGPPVVTTFLFFYQVIAHLCETKRGADIAAVVGFFVRFYLMYGVVAGLSGWQMVGLYFLMRLIESHHFTWITSMSHLPMPMYLDKGANPSWVEMHVQGTQNVEGGWLNNWLSGHLNWQIEHHLFPRMPRHNLPLVHDRVKALLDKHGIPLVKRPLFGAMFDVVTSMDRAIGYFQEKKRR